MKEQKTYKAPVKMGYCPRCKTRTLSEHIDYPDEMERDTVCAVCGALKATEQMKQETPAMEKASDVFQLIAILACVVALVALWFEGLAVGLVATTISAACQIGTVILYRKVPKQYCDIDERR